LEPEAVREARLLVVDQAKQNIAAVTEIKRRAGAVGVAGPATV
jgi:hypothetical protein